MTQFYSNPAHEREPHRLPDCEVFYAKAGELHETCPESGMTEVPMPAGFYFWFCYPGCLPSTEAFGPFRTEQEAINSAQESCDEGEYAE